MEKKTSESINGSLSTDENYQNYLLNINKSISDISKLEATVELFSDDERLDINGEITEKMMNYQERLPVYREDLSALVDKAIEAAKTVIKNEVTVSLNQIEEDNSDSIK